MNPGTNPVINTERQDHPRQALGLLWPNLPLLLTGSLLVSLSWLLVRVVAPGLSLVAVILHLLLVVPTFAALLVTCQVLLTGQHVRVTDLFRTWGRRYRRSVTASLPVAGTVLLTFGAFDVWHLSGQAWMLVSVGLGLTVSVLALFSWVLTLPYALRSDSRSVKRWWLVGFFGASRNALPVLGVLSLLGLAVWVVQSYSLAFTFLVPGVLALVWTAAFAAAADRTPLLESHTVSAHSHRFRALAPRRRGADEPSRCRCQQVLGEEPAATPTAAALSATATRDPSNPSLRRTR
jgi:MFS family permease